MFDPMNPSGDAGLVTGNDGGAMVFDLSGVEENKAFEVMPKGKYLCVVETQEYVQSKNSGNWMVASTYVVADGEFAGRKLFDYFVLTGDKPEMGLGKLKKFLNVACPEVDQASFNPTYFCDNAVGIGRQLIIDVGVKSETKGEYAGTKRNTVRDMEAAGTDSFLNGGL